MRTISIIKECHIMNNVNQTAGNQPSSPTNLQFNEIHKNVFVDTNIVWQDVNGKQTIMLGNKVIDEYTFTLFRHIPFSWLYHLVNKKEFTFISPNKWNDPFENLFFNPQLKVGNNYVNGCLCFTYIRNVGEESLWKNYQTDSREPLVKLDYNFINLLKQLSAMATNEGYSVYLTLVNYTYNRKDIVKQYDSIGGKKGISYSSLEEYLTYMSIKRKAFANENEVRIFLVSNHCDQDKTAFNLSNFNVADCIKRVTLQPLSFMYEKPREDYYHDLQELYHQGMKDWIKNNFGSFQQSRLYDLG